MCNGLTGGVCNRHFRAVLLNLNLISCMIFLNQKKKKNDEKLSHAVGDEDGEKNLKQLSLGKPWKNHSFVGHRY